MDTLLVWAGVVAVLLVALVSAIWLLVALNRKDRRRKHRPTRHVFRGQGEAVRVTELLEEARERGEGIRLNWSTADEERVSEGYWPGMRPYVQDHLGTVEMGKVPELLEEWPTAILPRTGELP
jgi:hypothetical protein